MSFGLSNGCSPRKFRFAAAMRKRPTAAERALRRELNKQTQFRFKFQVLVHGYILDFYCSRVRIAVEVDGSSHDKRKAHDQTRDAALRNRLGIITLRFTNEAALSSPQMVVSAILAFCESAPQYKNWNEGRRKK